MALPFPWRLGGIAAKWLIVADHSIHGGSLSKLFPQRGRLGNSKGIWGWCNAGSLSAGVAWASILDLNELIRNHHGWRRPAVFGGCEGSGPVACHSDSQESAATV